MNTIIERFAALWNDERGAMMTEYMETLVLVSVGVAATAVPIGLAIMRYYDFSEFLLMLPIP